MKISQEFEAVTNFGFEAPDHKRDFVKPILLSCTASGFTWMIDSNGIVWITNGDQKVLTSPCLHYCLGSIKVHHPFVDVQEIIKVLESINDPSGL